MISTNCGCGIMKLTYQKNISIKNVHLGTAAYLLHYLSEYLQYISCWIELLPGQQGISIVEQSTIQIDWEEQVCFMAPVALMILKISGNKHSQHAVEFYRQAEKHKSPMLMQPFSLTISQHCRLYSN
jgi:hypothetical protein